MAEMVWPWARWKKARGRPGRDSQGSDSALRALVFNLGMYIFERENFCVLLGIIIVKLTQSDPYYIFIW